MILGKTDSYRSVPGQQAGTINADGELVEPAPSRSQSLPPTPGTHSHALFIMMCMFVIVPGFDATAAASKSLHQIMASQEESESDEDASPVAGYHCLVLKRCWQYAL